MRHNPNLASVLYKLVHACQSPILVVLEEEQTLELGAKERPIYIATRKLFGIIQRRLITYVGIVFFLTKNHQI